MAGLPYELGGANGSASPYPRCHSYRRLDLALWIIGDAGYVA